MIDSHGYNLVCSILYRVFRVGKEFISKSRWTRSMLLWMWTESYDRLKMILYMKCFKSWPILFQWFSKTQQTLTQLVLRWMERNQEYLLSSLIIVAEVLQEMQGWHMKTNMEHLTSGCFYLLLSACTYLHTSVPRKFIDNVLFH